MTKRPRSSPDERSNQPAAAYPPWLMLEQICEKEVQGCSSSIADGKTVASASTSCGVPISVSLCLASPPEGSRVCVQRPADVALNHAYVLAAHRDSVLVQLAGIHYCMTDHFVYNTGDAAADPSWPPSLSLLTHNGLRRSGEESRWSGCGYLNQRDTGLLRRGEVEFVVAELNMEGVGHDPQAPKAAAELLLLRSAAAGEWIAKRPPMSHYDRKDGELPASWVNQTVIPFGDRLCWVDLNHGLMFADVFNENPGLRYVPLPVDPCITKPSERNVCVTDGGSTIKLVDICPRYFCQGAGRAYCQRSHHAYTVRTWTLRMHDMAWVMDCSIESTELWCLDGYKGIPRVKLDCPAVSIDDPHVICFVVCEGLHSQSGDWTLWRIMVDMRSKTLRSAFHYPEGRKWYTSHQQIIPSKASGYFNSKPSSGSKMRPSQAQTVLGDIGSERHAEIMLRTSNIITHHGRPECKWSSNTPMKAASLEKILAALKEIPGLDRDDMLKAYRSLQSSFGSPNGFEEG
ncbi:unnamed protein product [Urochloa decumbens]|uniref:DUF1618 domain-containing protein n=1 Tax=Urochloa decumbens TaxID=240449 RepID=A0ABC9AVN2_9POAL